MTIRNKSKTGEIMKKITILILIIFSLIQTSYAQASFSKKASGQPILIQKGTSKMWCSVCGMNLKMFYKTSHAVELKNGDKKQYCSIRCLVVDHDHSQSHIKNTFVIDAAKENLIDAYKATYVLGSSVPGTMTKISKYAFASTKDAKTFQNKYGGKIVNFQNAYNSAKQSISSDIAMTNKKRQAKMHPMGKKLYEKKCQQINVNKYSRINLIKADLKSKKLCGNLKEKQLQAVALYLWDIVRLDKSNNEINIIKVDKSEKCPVCGMFVYKYPKWAAQLYVGSVDHSPHYSFDGVKDMMKFYHKPEKWGKYIGLEFDKVLVTDYYTQNAINGKKAFYVAGSNILGPMGKELIPFGTMDAAKIFFKDHLGTNIYTFEQLTETLVYQLDE